MEFRIDTAKKKVLEKDVSPVFFLFSGDAPTASPLFKLLGELEKEYLGDANFLSSLKEKESRTLVSPGTFRKIFFIGIGKKKDFTGAKAGMAMRMAVQLAKKEGIKKIGCWADFGLKKAGKSFHEAFAVGAIMGNFEFVKYKTPPEEGFVFVEEIRVLCLRLSKDLKEGLRAGTIIGEEVDACRDLANTPGGDMTPKALAAHAEAVAKKHRLISKILDAEEMKKLGMGGVLGVSRGSSEPPRFIVLEYRGGKKKDKPIVFVGKGVTFDTGGLNLKPSSAIYEMHMDMSGGAAVIHAIAAIARLKLKRNIVGLVPAVENMPSGSSYRPGDVLRTMSGKTIEVLDTDAEGRVILADALSYAERFDPALVVDVATLTGAAIVALGQRYSGLFTPEKKLERKFRDIGEETGDRVWPLPLSAEYEEEIKGTFGDVANVGKTRYGGATTGAVFLWQFAKKYPWAHIDIAPRMTTIDGEYLAKGAAGAGVHLLVGIAKKS